MNDQIVETLTQTTVMNLGASPSLAAGALYQAVAQAIANLANNATLEQQQGATIMMAVASTASAIILAQKP